MESEWIKIAQTCLDGAYHNTLSFPEIIERLSRANFEGYLVDYRRNDTTYYLKNGESIVLKNPSSQDVVNSVFNQVGIVSQIQWAQSNTPDYSYPIFCERVKAFGCAGYLVSFSGRRVLYFGYTAETHVEHFPK